MYIRMPFGEKSFEVDCEARSEAQQNANGTNNSLSKTLTRFSDGSHQAERETGLGSFLQNTTLHGARFLSTGNIFRRLLWSVALILCFGCSIYQVYNTVDAFYNRPFNTKITTKTADKAKHLKFPAVTLCNFNFFNLRRYRNDQKSKNVSREQIERKLDVYAKLMANSQDVFNNKSKQQNPELFWRLDEPQLKYHFIVLYGHRMEEMLLPSPLFSQACIINEIHCGPKNFTSFISSIMGQCYTFNSGHGGLPVINASMSGHLNSLRIMLNIERDSYLDSAVNPFVGLKVLVHDQQTFPLMGQFAFAIQPGFRTLFGIKKKKIINLPKPYSTNCTMRNLDMFQNTSYTYSKPACMMQCLHKFVIKKCACRPIEYKDLKTPICAMNDTLLCMIAAYETFAISEEKHKCENSCPEPCEHIQYDTTLSYAGLQRNVFINNLNKLKYLNTTKQFPVYEHFLNMSDSEKKDYIDNNIVSLDIYLQDMSYDEIEQRPVFELWTLIATLGGNFGLFLGISILTILEFVDFILKKIYFFIFKQNDKETVANVVT